MLKRSENEAETKPVAVIISVTGQIRAIQHYRPKIHVTTMCIYFFRRI